MKKPGRPPDAKSRAKAIAFLQEDSHTVAEIAAHTGSGERSVHRWLKEWHEGKVALETVFGQPRKYWVRRVGNQAKNKKKRVK